VAYIGAFEEAVATEARHHHVDGVICGHIHHAADRTFAGVHYLNCGDWVESCTAIVETLEGELRVVHWCDSAPARIPEQGAASPAPIPLALAARAEPVAAQETR
jgi:hypothetical protein